ncbi:IS4/Tn5 family transposase DNA-binding protein (plasmid) [Ralstonia pseudosolanacearum]
MALEAPCGTETEFADLDLGDARRNKRARTLMAYLYTHLDALLMNQEFTSGASDGVHRDLP